MDVGCMENEFIEVFVLLTRPDHAVIYLDDGETEMFGIVDDGRTMAFRVSPSNRVPPSCTKIPGCRCPIGKLEVVTCFQQATRHHATAL